jgi:hypothetical protein
MGARRLLRFSQFGVLLLCAACQTAPTSAPIQEIQLHQNWLQPGDLIVGYAVVGGLGDISIALSGNAVYAPFDGSARRDPRNCVLFSSPDVPAYLFRLCGLNAPRFGNLRQGEVIGRATLLQFATLRKQPSGKWAIVEPSQQMLERTLNQP